MQIGIESIAKTHISMVINIFLIIIQFVKNNLRELSSKISRDWMKYPRALRSLSKKEAKEI
jgi:hypothetical protein